MIVTAKGENPLFVYPVLIGGIVLTVLVRKLKFFLVFSTKIAMQYQGCLAPEVLCPIIGHSYVEECDRIKRIRC